MDYFYTHPKNISPGKIVIDGEEFSHLTRVMRKKAGDVIRIVDGAGAAYDMRLEEIRKKTAHGIILSSYPSHNEPEIKLTLAVGILKNPSKFDFLVEKATEIGVYTIVPLKTERTIPSHAKTERWQKLALAAMKQCGRSYLPKVRELITLEDYLHEENRFDLKLIAHEKQVEQTKVRNRTSSSSGSVVILIGSEGGFSEEEFKSCINAGYEHLCFGARRLRTETAAIASSSLILIPRLFDEGRGV